MRSVTIASGKKQIALPNGFAYDAGVTVILTDEQFSLILPALFPGTVIDNGPSGTVLDQVVTQAAVVAAHGAQASVGAPVALTAVAAAGATPTKAEFDALLADVTAMRTKQALMVTDIGTAIAKINGILTSIKGAGKAMAAS